MFVVLECIGKSYPTCYRPALFLLLAVKLICVLGHPTSDVVVSLAPKNTRPHACKSKSIDAKSMKHKEVEKRSSGLFTHSLPQTPCAACKQLNVALSTDNRILIIV